MAKVLANDAVISNDDEWVWNGEDWSKTSDVTASKRPDRAQTDHARTLARSTDPADLRAAAEELIATIGQTGSLQAARRLLSERRDLEEASHPQETAADQWVEVEVDPEILVKTYSSSKQFEADSPELIRKGWQPQVQTEVGGHINVGRTASAAVLTGGLSLLVGASRTKDP